MPETYEDELARIRSAARSGNVDGVEKIAGALATKWNRTQAVRLMVSACEELAGASAAEPHRTAAVRERIATQAIKLAGDSEIDSQLRLLESLRLGVETGELSGERWAQARRSSAGQWLEVWRKLLERLDPRWNPKDPENHVLPFKPPPGVPEPPSGAAPSAYSNPKARADYEAHLRRNEAISARNKEQGELRRLKTDHSGTFVDYLSRLYVLPPEREGEIESLLSGTGDEELKSRTLRALAERRARP